jgi:hypothetical protein
MHAFMCVRVCCARVRSCACMHLAIRALCVPKCKRQVTRLTSGTNGADPWLHAKPAILLFVGVCWCEEAEEAEFLKK